MRPSCKGFFFISQSSNLIPYKLALYCGNEKTTNGGFDKINYKQMSVDQLVQVKNAPYMILLSQTDENNIKNLKDLCQSSSQVGIF